MRLKSLAFHRLVLAGFHGMRVRRWVMDFQLKPDAEFPEMKIAKTFCLCLPLVLTAAHAQAQDLSALPRDQGAMRNSFYLGGGKARGDDPLENDDTPWSIGFMHQLDGRKLILGGDLGREGTMIDSTWGQNDTPTQATSFNFLLGGNMVETGGFRADAALLLGIRESFADCPDSSLGYQCWADTAPDTEYTGNVGGLLALSFDRVMVGLRATGESTQILGGFRF